MKGTAVRVVIVRDHYGSGVTTHIESEPGEVVPQPSVDAAVAYWQMHRGLARPRVVDDRFGRYVVEFDPPGQ